MDRFARGHPIVGSLFPRILKSGTIIPVHKKGEHSQLMNYRPITICNNTSKIFERILYNQIIEHIMKNNLLSPNQYGFCKSRSTLFAMTHLQTEICNKKAKGFHCASVFIDLSKAFDVINHKILAYKLKHQFGFSLSAVNLIISYLTGRKQRVRINDIYSEECIVTHGVPQGSILGPLLFLLYFNDISALASNDVSLILYADDCTLIFKSGNPNDLQNIIQIRLNILQTYFKANSLFLNASKTKVMYFNKGILNLNVCIDNTSIELIDNFKFLGFYLDNKLKWDKQIDFILKKLNSVCCLLQRLRQFLPKKILLLIFKISLFFKRLFNLYKLTSRSTRRCLGCPGVPILFC